MQSLIICIDNSEHTRNGDFGPSRLMQQREAVAELLRVQMRSNPENDIALMATSSRQNRPEMLLPLSREQVTFQRKLYAAESQGTADPITSLRIAQLALKHRKNRRANQRVVLFLGSPLNEEKENSQSKGKGKEKEKTNTTTSARELKRLGLALRKANISLDLVVFGEPAEVAKSVQTLQPLVTALGPTMCQLISVHSPQQVISQQLLQQLNWLTETVQRAGPAVLGEDGESGDAELMLAIQMSLQEGAAKKVEKEVEKREGGKGSQSTEKSAISKSNGGKFGKMPRLEEKSSAKTTGVGEPGKRASLRAKEGGKNRSKNRSGVSSSSSSSSAKTNASSAADDDEDHDLGDQLLLAVMALEEGGGGQKKQQQSAEAALANQSNAASRIPMAIKTGFSLTNTPSSSNRTLSSTSKNRIPRLVLYKHKVAARKSKNTAKAAKAAKAGADHNAPRFLEVRNSSQSSTSKGRSSSSVNSSNILDRLNARESDGKSSKTSLNGSSSSNSKQKNSFIGYYKSNGGGSCTALKGEEKGKSSALLGNTAAAAVAGPEKQKSTSDKKSNHSAEKAAAAEAGQSKKAEALLVNTKKIQAMINAKVHSLLAAAASKVVGPLEPHVNSPWNLNNLPTLDGSVFKHINTNINGMIIPWMYVGMCFSAFCWHNEDHWTYSINYLHWGEPKIWYGVPGNEADKFEEAMQKVAPELFIPSPDLLHRLVTTCNPNILSKEHGVPIYKAVQEAGEFIVTFPRSYHSGFNQGFNFAEAVNFATRDWLNLGRLSVANYALSNRFTVFSHDELICKMADSYNRLDMQLARETYNDLLMMAKNERELRDRMNLMGIISSERYVFETMGDDNRSCCRCNTTCFLSALRCKCPDETEADQKDEKDKKHKAKPKLVCLNHYDHLCSKCSCEDFTLLYRYSMDELKVIIVNLRKFIEDDKDWIIKTESEVKGLKRQIMA